ncbi:MAG TPA: nitrite/sulfite reductase [Burkholderiales bacterium]|nr:nitrite/sulfite reductase [Burkholderiales bacterium]
MGATESFDDLADLDEISRYEDALRAYLNLEIDEERFTAIRLQQGIYGQRQGGVNMIRVKIPGGLLVPEQLNAVADVLDTWAQHETAHITTRTSIQIHYVPLADTPDALRRLAAAGLTSREACGNTVRNMTACPMAGVCPREHTDIDLHLQGALRHFLRNPLNQQLPRKFKISFSGCESDCAQGMLHDLGIVAVREGERFGFKLLAGGGLGHKPREAIVVEKFIGERDLLPAMEAVIALHSKYSDRTKRAKSRIKFLVDRFSAEGFVEKFREEFARTRSALAAANHPKGEWRKGGESDVPGSGAPRKLFAQKQPEQYALPLAVPLGDLSAKQLRGIARIATEHGLRDLRTTQDQNLLALNVPASKLETLRAEFSALGLREPQTGDDVVACPGTSTCRLGITSSTILAPKLLEIGGNDLRIRVSGCHNGCAQPEMGDIGIYGEGRRMHKKLIPHYQMYFGGNGLGGGALALKGPSVPSARIEEAIRRVKQAWIDSRQSGESFFAWTRRQASDYFATLLADLIEVREEDVPAVSQDHGQNADFKVLQLGGGECAGASQVQIGSAFFEAAHERGYRTALYHQRKYAEAAQCAENIVRLIGQGLFGLVTSSKTLPKLEQISDLPPLLDGHLPADLAAPLAAFAKEFAPKDVEWDEPTVKSLSAQIDTWTHAAAAFSVGRDRQLDLTEALPPKAQPIRIVDKRKAAAGEIAV